MSRFRLLALDIDGTLVNSQNELTDATRRAVLRAKQAGIQIVLATGRRYSRALPLVEPLELDVPLVTASGALIKQASDHRTLYRAEFHAGALERCLQRISAAGYSAILYADTFHEGFDYFCSSNDSDQEEMLEFLQRNAGCERVCPAMMADPPAGIFAGFAMGTRAQMLGLQADLERQLSDCLYVHVLRSPRYTGYMCEIAPFGVSKWTGILRLADAWGIQPHEICAAGDDVNDIPMIRAAGLGIAMGNALDTVKAVAHRIAPSHDEDGLVQVVDWLLN